MNKEDSLQHEGFWYSDYEPWFPKPEARLDDMPRKSLFLDLLREAEVRCSEQGKEIHWRGYSNCRICDCLNGSTEFELNGWRWPSGYRHYIEDHNVRPSLAFQMMIMGERFKYPTKSRQELKREAILSELKQTPKTK